MRNHRLYIEEVFIGGAFLIGQYEFTVKDIQAFVFHCTHVEKVNGHNHVNIQVVLQPEDLFVPFHGALKRFQSKHTTVPLAFVYI